MAHSFNRRIVGKSYCSICGLISLNNTATRKQSCDTAVVKKYKAAIKKYDDMMKKCGWV